MDQWSAVHHVFAVETFFFKITTLWYQRNKYSDDILTLGDTERFLITTQSRNGYTSFESRLLQQIKHLKAESELCWHRKTLKQHEPLLVVAPDDQHVDIQLSSTYRADRSDGYFIVVYFFTPTNYTLCENCQTVILLQEVHFVSNLLPLWTNIQMLFFRW
jgi:hypothetical protein